MQDTMHIQVKTFELLDWLLPKTERFPRAHRHTLTARIMHTALDFHEALTLAQTASRRHRAGHLRRCDALLQQLRIYFRLIHRWQWLSNGQYLHVSTLIEEIGRMLGGWLKQIKSGHSG